MALAIGKRINLQPAACFVLCLTALGPIHLPAQDSLNVRFLGCYPCGQYYYDPILYMSKQATITSARINGHAYVFATAGTGIIVFNVDDPVNPARVSHISSPIDLAPFVIDTLLYVTAIDRGLQIYNVADPMHPVEIGHCASEERIWSVFVQDSIAYATGPNQLTLFNVADPSAPFIVGTWTPGLPNAILPYVYVQGRFAYVTVEQAGGMLFIVDVGDPGNPVLVGYCGDLGNVRKLRVRGDYAYVIEWGGLGIVDVSDPFHPTYLWFSPGASDVYLAGDYAYCAGRGINIFDISYPPAPFLVGAAYDDAGQYAITVLDSIAYCIVEEGLTVFDVSEPQLPYKIGAYPMLTDISRIKIQGDVAVASSWHKPAVATITIADPASAWGLAIYDIGHYYDNWTPEIAVQGNYVYVAALDSGVRVLDITEPANMVEVGHCILPGSPVPRVRDVCVQGDYVYAAAGYDYAFAVINVAVPAAPYVVGHIPGSDTLRINDICVVGDHAYCATNRGLQIIDVANPFNPHTVAKCTVSTYQCDAVFVAGDYAYLDDYANVCLWIIDISDPLNPLIVNQLPDFNVSGLCVAGNYLFLGGPRAGDGLRIYDVSDPMNLELVGYYRTPFIWIGDVAVVDDYVYLACYDMGLLILQYYGLGIEEQDEVLCQGGIRLNTIGNNIRISYALNSASRTTISLFDVSGRMVSRRIADEPAGLHTRLLESAHVPSGVYFLRIETNAWHATRKIVLVK